MRVERHTSPQAFLETVEPYLLAHEIEVGLIMGIARRVAPDCVEKEDFYFASVHDDTNEVVGVAMRTPPHGLVTSDLPEAALDPFFANVAEAFDALPHLMGPADIVRAFATRWTAHAGVSAQEDQAMRIHVLREVEDIEPSSGERRVADTNDVSIGAVWAKAFNEAVHARFPGNVRQHVAGLIQQKRLHVWEDGNRVSMAAAVSPTKHGARIGYVYTPPNQRAKGYATSLVADLSRQLLAEGREFCFLYTDLANPTSNAIYRRIGYQPVQDVLQIRLT